MALICVFTWIGFVGGISFLEAWLKFRAPGVTIPIGLGIGRLVFHALNKVEWFFALIVTGSTLCYGTAMLSWSNVFLLLVLFILLMQTCWLLPLLDARADLHIREKPVPPSKGHVYFVMTETAKLVLLLTIGFRFFK